MESVPGARSVGRHQGAREAVGQSVSSRFHAHCVVAQHEGLCQQCTQCQASTMSIYAQITDHACGKI